MKLFNAGQNCDSLPARNGCWCCQQVPEDCETQSHQQTKMVLTPKKPLSLIIYVLNGYDGWSR